MATRPGEVPTRVAAGAKLRYGDGAELVVGEALFADMRGALVLSRTEDGADALVEVLNPCATIRARTESRAPEGGIAKRPPTAMAGILGMGMLEPVSIVAAGAPLSWSDGTPAGTLAAERQLPSRARTKKKKGKHCFRWTEPDARIEPIEICVPSKRVKEHDPSSLFLGSAAFGTGSASMGALGALSSGAGSGLWADELGGELGTGGLGLAEIGDAGSDMGGFGTLGTGGGGVARGGTGPAPTPSVRVRTSTVSTAGSLAQNSVRKAVGKHLTALRYCAESEDPIATGTLEVSFSVGADGSVASAEAQGIPAIGACVERSIERWSLPASDGDTKVDVTLVFENE
jgi:hypothetical protein